MSDASEAKQKPKAKRLTRRKKAVAVAQDVLAQLRKRNNNMVPGHSGYIRSRFYPLTDDWHGDFQQILPDFLAQTCEVCALGAALISKARLFNHVPIEDLLFCDNSIYPDGDEVKRLLESVFTRRQADMIEAAYERLSGLASYCTPSELADAIAFGERFDDPKNRLRAIMKNIVANGGDFRPSVKGANS